MVLALPGIATAQAEHPHLLFTPQKTAVIRAQLAGPYKAVWQVVQQRADSITSENPVPQELGLKRFNRRVLFIEPDVVIVADEVQTTGDKDLELRFHPEYAAIAEGGTLLSRGPRAVLRIDVAGPDGATVTGSDSPGKDYLRPALAMGIGRDGSGRTMHTVRLAKRGNAGAVSSSFPVPRQPRCRHG